MSPPYPFTLGLLLTACCCSLAYGQQRNVLLIIADDLGADSFPLTATGGTQPPMPNIAALKNSGVLFSQAYAHPTCSPTRASLLTGRHSFRTGIGAQLVGATSAQLSATEFTLPEAFAANSTLGYSLGMFGKWHLNAGAGTNDAPRSIGGWPHFAGTIGGALTDYSAWTKVVNNVSTATTTYATTDTANDVISFISTRPAGTPWFAWAAFNAPHAPFHVPPAALHTYGTPTTNRSMYEAACQALDTEVGRILANVNLSTTNVIFLGDNGTPGQVIQAPYTSAHSKETIYAGGVRVPMIIAGPAVVTPNRTCSTRVHAVDLYSTILELAGISVAATQPAANEIDSRSLLGILNNTTPNEARSTFSQQFSSTLLPAEAGSTLTNQQGYSLLSFDDGREELYNTAVDANQLTNLLGSTIATTAQEAYVSLKRERTAYQTASVPGEPRLASWFTANSGQYARLYATVADQNAQNAVATWSRGVGVQGTPTYSDVQQIDYSTNWVYVHTTGLASYTMGPWYLNAGKTNLFPNYPSNTGTTYRIPRVPTIPTTKTNTPNGVTGRMVNGVSLYDLRDAFSYSVANAADGSPGSFQGDGIWNRDAYHNEAVTFDAGLAHSGGNNYHNHAQPAALRYQLGDHVNYNSTTNVYTESTAPVTKHSPIVGWAADGLPVYGPYGYSDPMNTASGLRRMVSGFVLRSITVRQALPLWAQRIQNRTTLTVAQYGPAVGGNYLLGHYIEDYDFRGDLGQTQTTGSVQRDFDLNEQNVRFCLTPEFPAGTWAYFTPILADGTPVMPYTTGRQYFGSPTGGNVTRIEEPVFTTFIGGPFIDEKFTQSTHNPANGNITLRWSAVEGGTYAVEASQNLQNWSAPVPALTAVGDANAEGAVTDSGATFGQNRRFYRLLGTGLAAYDRTGFAGTYFTALTPTSGGPNTVTPNSGAAGSTVNVVIELDSTLTPALPPAAQIVFSVTVSGTGVTVTNIARPSQTLVTATFTVAPGTAIGARNVNVRFRDATGPQRTLTAAFTVN